MKASVNCRPCLNVTHLSSRAPVRCFLSRPVCWVLAWNPPLCLVIVSPWSLAVHDSSLIFPCLSWPWHVQSTGQVLCRIFLFGFFWYFLVIRMRGCIFLAQKPQACCWALLRSSDQEVRDIVQWLVLQAWVAWLRHCWPPFSTGKSVFSLCC